MQPSMADNSDDEMPPLQMIPLPGKLVILAVMQKCYIFVALWWCDVKARLVQG